MKIVINHLTRMSTGYICAAGLDTDTDKHVRPVHTAQLPVSLLERNGGPFDIANIVDLGPVIPRPNAPRYEDYIFHEQSAWKIGKQDPDDFWQMLMRVSEHKFRRIFGDELKLFKKAAFLPKGKGETSLGCLIPTERPSLEIRGGDGKLRIHITDSDLNLNLSVADIRFYGDDHLTPHEPTVRHINRLLEREESILGVGVTFPKSFDKTQSPVHWVQVNAVHLKSQPVWQLG